MTSSRDFSGYPSGLPLPGLDVTQIETVPGVLVSYDGTGEGAAGAYLTRFAVPSPLTFNTASFYVGGSASGNVAAGVYEKTASGFSLVAATASTAVGSTSAVQDLTIAVNLVPGIDYFLALGFSSGSCSFGLIQNLQPIIAIGGRVKFAADAYPLPASIADEDAADTDSMAWLLLRNV